MYIVFILIICVIIIGIYIKLYGYLSVYIKFYAGLGNRIKTYENVTTLMPHQHSVAPITSCKYIWYSPVVCLSYSQLLAESIISILIVILYVYDLFVVVTRTVILYGRQLGICLHMPSQWRNICFFLLQCMVGYVIGRCLCLTAIKLS